MGEKYIVTVHPSQLLSSYEAKIPVALDILFGQGRHGAWAGLDLEHDLVDIRWVIWWFLWATECFGQSFSTFNWHKQWQCLRFG